MKHLIYIMTVFLSTLAFCQSREMHIDGYTSLLYKKKTELCSQIDLDTIQNTDNKWHFRIWANIQAIDLWQTQKGKTVGKVTSWTKEYVPNDKEPTNRFFFEKHELDSDQVKRILALIDSTKIKDIPDQFSIKKWRQGRDGIMYIIETANLKDYYFKTYWVPTAQDSLEEAITVQSFMDSALIISQAKDIWYSFASRIPFECYINDAPWVTCKVLTKKERRKFKKERKNYRQQHLYEKRAVK